METKQFSKIPQLNSYPKLQINIANKKKPQITVEFFFSS